MEIEVRRLNSGGLEVLACGRLDQGTVGGLRPVLLDASYPPARLLLNLSELDAIDSAGMALVMMARIELEASGTRFVVQCSDPDLIDELLAAGLGRFVDIAPRRLDALRALGKPPGSVDELLANAECRDDAVGDGFAREPDLAAQKRRFAVRDVAIR